MKPETSYGRPTPNDVPSHMSSLRLQSVCYAGMCTSMYVYRWVFLGVRLKGSLVVYRGLGLHGRLSCNDVETLL